MLFRAPAILYAVSLYWASSLPRLPIPQLGLQFQDKLIHALAYAILSALIYLALTKPWPLVTRPVLWSVVLGFLYGASDEWHQHFVAGRTAEWADLAADLTGVLLAQVALFWWRSRVRSESRSARSGTHE